MDEKGWGGMNIDEKDLQVTYFKSSGPGGQKKNKTESAVRIRHVPSGLVVVAAESRSRLTNYRRALQRLEERLTALRRRPRKRITTRPTRAARERRLRQKKRRSEIKRGRGKQSEF